MPAEPSQVRRLQSSRKRQGEELERQRNSLEEGRRENRLLTEAKDRVEGEIGKLRAQAQGFNELKERLQQDLDEASKRFTVSTSEPWAKRLEERDLLLGP